MSDDPLFSIETRVNEITDAASAEMVVDLMGRVDWLSSRAREIKRMFEQQLIEWIEANGDLTIGESRYYVGPKKTDKCNDIRATVVALFEQSGGDFDLFCEALSANAIKVGAARKMLDAAKFAELFTTTIETDLKTGKPVQTVHRLDTRFVKSIPGKVPEGSAE